VDINQKLLEFFNIDVYQVKKVSPNQLKELRQQFTCNLRGTAVYYTDQHIIFTSDQTYKNWMYYAGFEYIEEELVESYAGGRGFLKIFSGHSRVERIIDTLLNSEQLNGDENDESVSANN
jgi:hypothetical protein